MTHPHHLVPHKASERHPAGVRRALWAYVPRHFRNPTALAMRLLKTGSAEARFAMLSAVTGLFATPLDLTLARREHKLYRREAPKLPIIVVCGPPRSGTTVVAQTLIRHLPVSYFNNLTSLFPRSPIVANQLWPGHLANHQVEPQSYYGKSRGLSGPNDALYLWDRWLGADRTRVVKQIGPEAARAMRSFFAAYQSAFKLPMVVKNNSLNVMADVVARELPTATFLCLRREPLWLAQALLLARRDIVGDEQHAYGIDDPTAPAGVANPLEDVYRQVAYYDRQADRVATELGPRFQMVAYEEFCADPASVVARVGRDVLDIDVDVRALRRELPPYALANRRKLEATEFRVLEGLCGCRGLYA